MGTGRCRCRVRPAPTHELIAAAPYRAQVDPAGGVAARVRPFAYRLARVATFPNGIVHLVPEPSSPFARLTALLVEEFPDHPPYGGLFAPAPHLTLDLAHGAVSEASTRRSLGDLLPVDAHADTLDLAWYESGRCHLVRRWHLGQGV